MKEEIKMIFVSEIKTDAPKSFITPLQAKVYDALSRLDIPYQRVETDEVITMEDCAAIDLKLNMKMVKTLFLSNSKGTEFWLFITCGDKPFRAKDFAAAMDSSRPSFAKAELMDSMLGTKIGAATVFSALLPSARDVGIVFDRDVAREAWYGCSDGTTTGYMKVRTDDILHKLLPFAGHSAAIIEV
jgi:Ala-tRNA(Pro) deacylase